MNPSIPRVFFPVLIFLLLLAPAPHTQARPEVIKEGISYYADEDIQTGAVRDLVDEKNIEEVYQFYTYFEAIYDHLDRVTVFKEYKRGAVIQEEHYSYNGKNATPSKKTVLIPGKTPEVTFPGKQD